MDANSGIPKGEVSRICAGLDAEVATWGDPAPERASGPVRFIDAPYCSAWINGRVVAHGLVVSGAKI